MGCRAALKESLFRQIFFGMTRTLKGSMHHGDHWDSYMGWSTHQPPLKALFPGPSRLLLELCHENPF